MKAKRIDKEFLVTDSSVNVYGFRLLTEGYMMERFQANPIGYRMHKRDDGVVLRWENLRKDGDKVYAKPVINLSNPFGLQTAYEVENGFLNAASVGGIVVVEFSDDPALMLPGQTGPTVTKWYNKEISLVDVPGNPNALVQLFDTHDNEINLTDFIHQTLKKQPIGMFSGLNLFNNKSESAMKKQLISMLAAFSIPNLSDHTDDSVILNHLSDLLDKARQFPDLQEKLNSLRTEKEKAVQDLADFKTALNKDRNKVVLDAALNAGKVTAKAAKDLADKYAGDPDGLKNLVDALPAYKPVTAKIEQEAGVLKELASKSWNELDMAGKLEDLKAADLDLFKAKFKAQFGKEYAG